MRVDGFGWERYTLLALFLHLSGPMLNLRVAFSLNTYDWVENWSYTSNSKGFLLFNDKYFIVVNEYEKIMYVLKILYLHDVCRYDWFFSLETFFMTFYVSIIFISIEILLFPHVHAFHLVLALLGRFTLLVLYGNCI